MCWHLELQHTQVKSDNSKTFKSSIWTPQGAWPMQQCSLMSSSQPPHALIPATPLWKAPRSLPFSFRLRMGVWRRASYPAPVCWRTTVTPLRVCLEGKQEQNNLFYPLAVRPSLAAVIARRSSAQVLKQFTALRTHPSRRRKRSLEAAGDDAAAAAAFVPSRRGMREVVGVGAADDPRRNSQKYTHRTRNRCLTSKRWLMNHYAHWEATCVRERACVRACVRPFYPAEWCSLMIQTEKTDFKGEIHWK